MKVLAPLFASLLVLASAQVADAKVKKEVVAYTHGPVTLEGYAAYDDAGPAKRPAVIVFHEWNGINDHTRNTVEKLAELGYFAFAADVYGKGIRPTDPKAAGAEAEKYKTDRKLTRARAAAGLAYLQQNKMVEPAKIAATGYCFGGMVALELARSGAPILGVVSFHGNLSAPLPAEGKTLRPSILVLHGAEDPYVQPVEVDGFEKEMRGLKADWQLVSYGKAVHAFTNPKSGTDVSKGAAYDASADRRSWEAMKTFLAERLGKVK